MLVKSIEQWLPKEAQMEANVIVVHWQIPIATEMSIADFPQEPTSSDLTVMYSRGFRETKGQEILLSAMRIRRT